MTPDKLHTELVIALFVAQQDRKLLERHNHPDVRIDTVACVRCKAEQTLIATAQVVLRDRVY